MCFKLGMQNSVLEDVAWIHDEVDTSRFADDRLGKRLKKLMGQLSQSIGESIPLACQDWANTKAAYRFFSNERVCEGDILAGHFESTSQRAAAVEGPILVLHDTTEFSYQRDDAKEIGITKTIRWGKDKAGMIRQHTVQGILMHSSLAVTTQGLPLGLAAVKVWTRKHFKGCNALKRRVNPTRVPIAKKESIRWLQNLQQSTNLLKDARKCVHIGDRESDIFELFCAAQRAGTHFLVRTCVDRLAEDGGQRVSEIMKKVRVKGHHRISTKDHQGNTVPVLLEIKYQRVKILPPDGKSANYGPQILTVIHARETGTPRNRKRIDWKLLTNLPVDSLKAAIEKLRWYALRWRIELFHKILKSGCKAEDSRMRSAHRLANLIAVFCILSWRVFWMTMLRRTHPEAQPKLALTTLEVSLLDKLVSAKASTPKTATLADYLIKIARLGGYLARRNDPPPGNKVMWRGLTRLTDIELGYLIGAGLVGN